MEDLPEFTVDNANHIKRVDESVEKLGDRINYILREKHKDGGDIVTKLGRSYQINTGNRIWTFVDFDAANGNMMRHDVERLNELKELIPGIDKIVVDFENQLLKVGFKKPKEDYPKGDNE